MKSYSFLKEVFDSYNDDNESISFKNRRVRKGWHTPQSRMNARKGTLGSFASITTKYNNVYADKDPSIS